MEAEKTSKEVLKVENVIFRPVCEGDREEFLAMSREFYASDAVLHPIPEGYHERAFAELLRSDVYAECYLFEENNGNGKKGGNCENNGSNGNKENNGNKESKKIIGFALLAKMYSREAGGLCIWLDELYLREGYRGQGIGSEFFAFLEKTHPAERYRLETDPENESAQRLYHRRGYRDLPYLQMIKGK